MNYIQFHDNLRQFIIFTWSDICSLYPNFNKNRLLSWQEKGYIKKIIRGYYIFSDIPVNEKILYFIANRIYGPSYISLEMAFSYYHLIPEATYELTSVTSNKTRLVNTPFGQYSYRHIKPVAMIGYKLVQFGDHVFKMAELEKALLDFFYWQPSYKTSEDFASLRFNHDILLEQLDDSRLETYLKVFSSKKLEKRIRNFLKYLHA